MKWNQLLILAMTAAVLGSAAYLSIDWWYEGIASSVARDYSREVPQFDCFSRPALAVAILRQEAERYFSEFVQANAQEAEDAPRANTVNGIMAANPTDRKSAGTWDRSTDLEKLAAEVSKLKNDLDRKLLLVYSQTQRTNQFVTCYLDHLQEEPGNYVVEWAPYALTYSHACGRTDEVVDAMEHACHFHTDIKGLKGLRTVLAEASVRGSISQRAAER